MIIGICENLDISLKKFCNENALKVYAPRLFNKDQYNTNSTPNSKEGQQLYLPKGSSTSEFTNALSTKHAKEERKA